MKQEGGGSGHLTLHIQNICFHVVKSIKSIKNQFSSHLNNVMLEAMMNL